MSREVSAQGELAHPCLDSKAVAFDMESNDHCYWTWKLASGHR